MTDVAVSAPRARKGIGERAFGGPTASSWREQALTRVAEIESLAEAFATGFEGTSPEGILAEGIHRHLETAREAAEGRPRRGGWERIKSLVGGSPLERAASNLDAAEIDLLRIAPSEYLLGQLPSLLVDASRHLAPDDARRCRLEAICTKADAGELTPSEKDTVIAAARASRSACRREIVRVRSFRNILYVTALGLTIATVAVVVLSAYEPQLLPVCFNPDDAVVCPTKVVGPVPDATTAIQVDDMARAAAGPWDIPLVALVGLVAAALAAAFSLRNLHGTTLPYSLPVPLAVLKLPSGALTAVLGLLLMRGEFVPGLSALDSPAQILAWAILFGYSQQLFTRFVDERAHRILNQVSAQEPPRETPATEVTRGTPPPVPRPAAAT